MPTEIQTMLSKFLNDTMEDPRIGPAHISLFLAILYGSETKGEQDAVVFKKDLVTKAKISETTYHRCMHQLHESGFICYRPSYDPAIGSTVHIANTGIVMNIKSKRQQNDEA